jgi:hypothetical protein
LAFFTQKSHFGQKMILIIEFLDKNPHFFGKNSHLLTIFGEKIENLDNFEEKS